MLYPWTQQFWAFLHVMTLYPNQATQDVIRVIRDLYQLMPCQECREHYITFSNAHPPESYTGLGSMFKWSIDLHNYVNTALGKPTMSYHDAVLRWGDQSLLFILDDSVPEITSIDSNL